jgi:integrase
MFKGCVVTCAPTPRLLRHAFVSLMVTVAWNLVQKHQVRSHLLKAGVHPKVVSERLGHSAVGITQTDIPPLNVFGIIDCRWFADADEVLRLPVSCACHRPGSPG